MLTHIYAFSFILLCNSQNDTKGKKSNKQQYTTTYKSRLLDVSSK